MLKMLRRRLASKRKSVFPLSTSSIDNFYGTDLVLIQPPAWGIGTPPLALGVLSAFLRSNGFKVLPLDLNLEFFRGGKEQYFQYWSLDQSHWVWSSPSRVQEFLQDHREMIDRHIEAILACKPKMVGFSVYASSYAAAVHYAERLKAIRPQLPIVIGGPHVSKHLLGREAAQLSCFDVVAQGEGELTLLDLMKRVKQKRSIADTPGTIARVGSEVVENPARELIRKLDDLPFTDLSDFNFAQYAHPTKLPIMGSRGCPNNCIYCSERVYWRTFRGFSPERIVAEIEAQFAKYPFLNRVEFQDSLVNGHIKRLEKFADLVLEKKLKFIWAGQAVIRKEMTYELFKKLADSGCECLAYGLETSSSELMLSIGKLLSLGTDLDRVVEDAHRAGISCVYNFMFGLPGETEEDAERSLEFLRKHARHVGAVNPSPSFCGFQPGTPGNENPEKYGIVVVEGRGMFWHTKDGKNTLPIRLERFEKFCELVHDLGIPTSYPQRQLLDRDRLLGNYYHTHQNYELSIKHLKRWLEMNPNDQQAAYKLERDTHKLRKRQRQLEKEARAKELSSQGGAET